MRKSDLVLIVLGVLVAFAVLVGGLSGDRWTDERTVRFTANDVALKPTDLVQADGAGATFNWTLPRNATAAHTVVHLYYSGQALRGGAATVNLRFTTPDGRVLPPLTASWALPQGSTSAELQIPANATWAEVPTSIRDTSSATHGLWWMAPLTLRVSVEAPSDLPLASYDFTASVTGMVTVYAAS